MLQRAASKMLPRAASKMLPRASSKMHGIVIAELLARSIAGNRYQCRG
jgi:hypothetical protein